MPGSDLVAERGRGGEKGQRDFIGGASTRSSLYSDRVTCRRRVGVVTARGFDDGNGYVTSEESPLYPPPSLQSLVLSEISTSKIVIPTFSLILSSYQAIQKIRKIIKLK